MQNNAESLYVFKIKIIIKNRWNDGPNFSSYCLNNITVKEIVSKCKSIICYLGMD